MLERTELVKDSGRDRVISMRGRLIGGSRNVTPIPPTEAGSAAFLGGGLYAFVTCVWEVELLAAGDLEGYVGPVMVIRLMCIVPSTL